MLFFQNPNPGWEVSILLTIWTQIYNFWINHWRDGTGMGTEKGKFLIIVSKSFIWYSCVRHSGSDMLFMAAPSGRKESSWYVSTYLCSSKQEERCSYCSALRQEHVSFPFCSIHSFQLPFLWTNCCLKTEDSCFLSVLLRNKWRWQKSFQCLTWAPDFRQLNEVEVPFSLPINLWAVKCSEIIAGVGRHSFTLSPFALKARKEFSPMFKATLEHPWENSQVRFP